MDISKKAENIGKADAGKIERGGFKEIGSPKNSNIADVHSYFDGLFKEMHDYEKEYYSSYKERLDNTPRKSGIWEGDRGESKFIPEDNGAREKLREYGLDGVEYKYAEPDFSKCCESEVKIDEMTGNRHNYFDANGTCQLGNFEQADIKCAERWNSISHDGKNDWTAIDVREWRRNPDNKHIWHECCDTVTMQLVPESIHNACKHFGGVAECRIRDNNGGEFDE